MFWEISWRYLNSLSPPQTQTFTSLWQHKQNNRSDSDEVMILDDLYNRDDRMFIQCHVALARLNLLISKVLSGTQYQIYQQIQECQGRQHSTVDLDNRRPSSTFFFAKSAFSLSSASFHLHV